MVLVTTNGYILTVTGPYLTDRNNSEDNITEHMLKFNSENITEWFVENFVLVLHRGFRDVAIILKDFR